jgi:transposase
VRRRGSPSFAPPAIIGIYDWAWRRNQRCGTLICDLECRKTIALSPDREPATAEAWLTGQPQIAVAARDRGGGYALATQKAPRGRRSDIFRVRSRSLEAYLPWLDKQWAAGRRNGSELWRSLKRQGFRGCLRVVSAWSGRRRRSDKMDASAISRTPSVRTIARLMTIGRDRLSKAETVTVAAIESGVELPVEAREIVADLQAMIRRKTLAERDPWIARAKTSLVAGFANGVTKDKAAVSAAISSGWSTDQAEGQICKLKLVKRQTHGRGKLDLPQARVIGAT